MTRRPPRSPLFPSPTPSRSLFPAEIGPAQPAGNHPAKMPAGFEQGNLQAFPRRADRGDHAPGSAAVYDHVELLGPKNGTGDRKSTRLNSSHLVISYAVFCLK